MEANDERWNTFVEEYGDLLKRYNDTYSVAIRTLARLAEQEECDDLADELQEVHDRG